jgi:formylglycine-generating enzyme required for sulfatase activity
MRRRTVPRASFVAILLLGVASSAAAGPSPEAEARRLDDSLYFVKSLDRGWEPLLADLDRTIKALADAPPERVRPVRVTADTAREIVATRRMKEGEPGERRALELFDQLAQTSVDETKRPGFHRACADILMSQADRAERAGGDANFAKAFDLARAALSHVPDFDKAFQMIARLGLNVARSYQSKEDYENALAKIDDTVKTLRAAGVRDDSKALSEVSSLRTEILQGTGEFRILWLGDAQALLGVKGGKTDYTNASLRFVGAGREPPVQSAAKPRRVRTGRWKVTVTGAGGNASFETTIEITTGGGEITLVPALPDGMLIVPAAGGADAFLVDRTEWSNQQYQAVTGRSRSGRPNAAVAGLTFEEAQAAAAAAGKRLPSLAQWTHAAFGSPDAKSPRYPWGDDEPEPGRQFVGGVEEAQDVESCRDYPSRTGCLNMAGNVWEWLDTGWLIGGGWKLTSLSRDVQPPNDSDLQPWTADFLRDPLPPDEVYSRFTNKAEEAKYFKYRATSETTLPQAGLRCVVPLGKPRR